MPPQSRGSSLPGSFQSKSTPNLSTAISLGIADTEESPSADPPSRPFSPSEEGTTPSEPASYEESVEDANLNGDFPLSESESDFSDEDIVAAQSADRASGHRRLYSGHSSRSHTHLPPSSTSLFPPFYNRPPTPLPPSPSLTSLLRPSFSTQTSHPTTPETSDTESHHGALALHSTNGTASSATAPSSLRKWTDPVARAVPKIPTYEYYGFALYLASSAAFLMYLLWAYLPSPFLHQLGIYYYLDRWWALAVPAWLVVGVVWIYVALGSYNAGYLTLGMESVECMVDECAYVAVVDGGGRIAKKRGGRQGHGHGGGEKGEGRRGKRRGHRRHDSRESRKERDYGLLGKEVDWGSLWSEGTDAVMDVPIGGVCEILYGAGRMEESRNYE